MRDPERINRICDLLKEQWHKAPDLRLGQFIDNAMFRQGISKDLLFHIEDDQMETCIRSFPTAYDPIDA